MQNASIDHRPGPYRPCGNQPAIARNPTVIRSESNLPFECAGVQIEPVEVAIIAGHEDSAFVQDRGEANRAVGGDPPSKLAGLQIETSHMVILR